MCGICGVAHADPSRSIDPGVLETMCELVAHRGPDAAGTRSWPGVGFGHRRLSIIDLEGGAQPLSNEDGTVWVTYNGELYNFPELMDLLTAKGHTFRTRCDTEVLVHAYEEFGPAFVERLNGMFAFALYDDRAGRVLLARDHFGIKPLFYAIEDGRLAFGSTVRSVLAGIERPPEIRPESLQEYLIFRYVASPYSFDRRVRRLPPAHLAIWEGGKLSVRRYWDLPRPADGPDPDDPGALSERLEERLRLAVRRQLISDVPVGAFCSGGLDSGLVTAFAAPDQPDSMETFSVGFEEAGWDETALARETAERFGTRHHVIRWGVDDLVRTLERAARFGDEPLSHPNSVPLYVLSELARGHVKVVLTGEGSDELFCGYPRYHIVGVRHGLRHVPSSGLRALGRFLGRLPGRRLGKLADQLPQSIDDAILFNSAYVGPRTVESLTGRPVAGALEARRSIIDECRVPGDPLATLSRYELSTYLGCALDRMDRMSMAHGLEGRVPFLDVPLVEWGGRLPMSARLSLGRPKRLVRSLAERTLGPNVARAGKSGFGLPLADWFRRDALSPLLDRLADPSHVLFSYLGHDLVQRCVREHGEARADHGELLWLLVSLALWTEAFLDRASSRGVLPRQTGAGTRTA